MIRWTPKEERIPWRVLLPIGAATILLMFALWPIDNQNVRWVGVVVIGIGYLIVVMRIGKRFRSTPDSKARRR